MKVNIIYLTNQCNLKCPYCYEKQGQEKREKSVITESEIDDTLNSIIREEPFHVSTVCLMGGEPFLEFDKIKYTFDKCLEIRRNLGKSISLNVISNGTLIHNHIDDLDYMINNREQYLSLDISFDGIFQYKRTGDSDIVQKNFLLLKERNIPFGISYTITKGNHERKVFLKEIVSFLELYYGKDNLKDNANKRKIRVNFDWTSLEKFYKDIHEFQDSLKEACDYLFTLYNVPICELSCRACGHCQKQLFDARSYSIPGKSDKILEPMKTNKTFYHFDQNIKEEDNGSN